jgi:arginase
MSRIGVIGVPLDLGGGRRGVDMGPSAVRIAGLAGRLTALGHEVTDLGDLEVPIQETVSPGDPRHRYLAEIARVCQTLHDRAHEVLRDGGTPVVLGGDHSLGAGSVAASASYARRDGRPLGLIWVDAHGDMNTPETTLSGNVHGMPLAALLGAAPAALADIAGFAPKVLPSHTVLIGVRNLDEREKAAVRASGVLVFTLKDIDRLGIAAVTEQAIAHATTGTVGVHVSFDLDVCDPSIAPGVGTPVKGGLDYREAHLLMEMVADSGRLIALDLVEVNPVLDVQNATAVLAAELAASAFGMGII